MVLYCTDMQSLEICRGFSYLLGVIEYEKTAVSSFKSGLFYRNFHEINPHAFSSIFPPFFRKHLEKYKFSFFLPPPPVFFFAHCSECPKGKKTWWENKVRL